MGEERPIGIIPPHPDRKPHPANGLIAHVHVGEGAVHTIVDPRSFENGGPEWVMRYGNPESIRYSVARLVGDFDYLLSGEITTREAMRRLRILRAARRALQQPSPTSPEGK